MPAVANKTVEKLEIAKDNFSEAIAREEGSKDSAITKAEEYLLTLAGYLETIRHRMGAKIKEMQRLKKELLAKLGKSETAELPLIVGTARETRAMPAVMTRPAAAKKQVLMEQEKIFEEIDAFKKLLHEAQEHLTGFNLAMTNYSIKIGNKYKFLILAAEEAAYLPEIKRKISSDIWEEIGNLKAGWEYFNSLDTDLMEAIMAWSMSASKNKSGLTSIDECQEAMAEFDVFLKNVKGKIERLGKLLKIQCSVQFEVLMRVTYALFKEAKSVLE